jgi:hypothetical protein
MMARECFVSMAACPFSLIMTLICPWKKSSMTFFHSVDRRKRRGFPGSTTAASSGGPLYPQPVI